MDLSFHTHFLTCWRTVVCCRRIDEVDSWCRVSIRSSLADDLPVDGMLIPTCRCYADSSLLACCFQFPVMCSFICPAWGSTAASCLMFPVSYGVFRTSSCGGASLSCLAVPAVSMCAFTRGDVADSCLEISRCSPLWLLPGFSWFFKSDDILLWRLTRSADLGINGKENTLTIEEPAGLKSCESPAQLE